MKRFLALLLSLTCAMALLSSCSSNTDDSSSSTQELIVFNYGDYIDYAVLELFEQETGITVKYEEYVSPEDMYTKYESGAIAYDVIITSEYMIEKMILAGEVLEIDYSSMENISNIGDSYWEMCTAFDPDNCYAVPYFWGTVGILYNTELVEEEVTSWSILWDESYSNLIIMENSMRDAFLVPLKLLGYSLNTTDTSVLDECLALLIDQKPLVQAYYVDETRDAMISGEAALAVIYSGDATAAMEYNDALDYVVPEEGSNIWIDCLFIPDSCQNKEAAQLFIDFLCREDIAMMNFEYIYYATPNTAVYDALDEETKADATIFPDEETLSKCEVYTYLGSELEEYYTALWKQLKAS